MLAVSETRLERERRRLAFEREDDEVRVAELIAQQSQDRVVVDFEPRDERAADAREEIVVLDALGERVRRLCAEHRRGCLLGEEPRKSGLARRKSDDAVAPAQRETADEPTLLEQR